MKSEEIKLTEKQRTILVNKRGGVDVRLFHVIGTNCFYPLQAVGGGVETITALNGVTYNNIKWENIWNVIYDRQQIENLIGVLL